MYIAASRHFDHVTIWEQRLTPNHAPTIKTVRALYNCYIKCSDWYSTHAEFSDSVEEGTPDGVLKKFLGLGTTAIDETTKYQSMFGDDLYELEFSNKKEMSKFLDSKPIDVDLFESDIPPELKALSALYYKCELPHINTTYYDIEVDYRPKKYDADHKIKLRNIGSESFEATVWDLRDYRSDPDVEVWDEPVKKWVAVKNSLYTYDGPIGFSSPLDPYAPLNSIAFYHTWKDEYVIFSVPPKSWTGCNVEELFDYSLFEDIDSKVTIVFCKNETELLTRSVEEIQQSDLLSGWNSSRFDDPYFAKRVEIVLGKEWLQMLSFPKGKAPWFQTKEVFFQEQLFVQFDGRVTLDYMELFKKFTVEDRDSWNLETVSQDHLGERFKKLDYEGTLHHLYNNNFSKFVRYNCRDTEILRELDKKYKFINLANTLIHESTCHFKNIVGTVRSAEMAINNYCWYELNVRVPDTKQLDEQGQAAGAYVLVPQTGMHNWIVCYDINSLYPNTIRTVNISPETLIGQFSEFESAWTEINAGSTAQLTFRWEKTQEVETKSARMWKEHLIELKYAISGYGTVFRQDVEGIIPALLGRWYSTRKQFQAQSKQVLGAIAATTDAHQAALLQTEYEFADMTQYAMKIKLNSAYGALLNQNFRFYDKRMGQSVTATGRCILGHQIRKGCEIIDGDYNINPITSDEDPRAINNEIASPCLIYGDTDSVVGGTAIYVNGIQKTIAQFYEEQPGDFIKHDPITNNYVKRVVGSTSVGFDGSNPVTKPINYVMKHTVKKRMFEVRVNGASVTITADHSIIVRRGTEIISTTPMNIVRGDKLISVNTPESVSP
jgi:DNA polymerase elongation subunit (family B)